MQYPIGRFCKPTSVTRMAGIQFLSCLLCGVLCCLTPTAAHAQTPEELAAAAGKAMAQQEFVKAQTYYEQLLKHFPQAAEIHSNLGLALYSQKKFPEAARALQEALRRNPDLLVPNMLLGRIHFDAMRYGEALPLLKKTLSLAPQDETARQLLAATFVGMGRFEDAVSEFQRLLTKNPRNVDALYGLGMVYLDLGQKAIDQIAKLGDSPYRALTAAEFYADQPEWQQLAEKSYREAATAATPLVYIALGSYLAKAAKLEEAEVAFREALGLDKLDFEARAGLARLYLRKGLFDQGLAEWNEAARIRPEFFDPLPQVELESEAIGPALPVLEEKAALGDFAAACLLWSVTEDPQWRLAAERLRNGLQAEVEKEADRIAQSPGDARVGALDLLRRKRYEHALKALLPVRDDPSTGLAVRTDLVRALFSSGRYQDLVQWASTGEQPWAELLYLRGSSYKRLALQNLERMVTAGPESARAYQVLGDTYVTQGLLTEAVESYQQGTRAAPGSAELWFSLGGAYSKQLKHKESAAAYQKVVELSPMDAQAWMLLGQCLLQLDQAEDAIPMLQKAVALDPTRSFAAGAALGRALAGADRNEEAVQYLEAASNEDTDGSVNYQLSLVYRKLGKQEAAKQALDRFRELREKKRQADKPLSVKP